MPSHQPRNQVTSRDVYNDSQQADGAKTKPLAFYNRLTSLPVVEAGVNTIQGYALGRFAFNAAETTVNTVGKYTAPVQDRFSAQISKVDEMATGALDYAQERFPIVGKSTEEIKDDISQPFLQTYETYKATLDQRVTQPALGVVKTVQDQLDQKVAEPARSIAKNVQERVTPIAVSFDSRLAPVVNTYDSLVQKWLPPEEGPAEGDEGEEVTEEDWSQTTRALHLSVRAQRRLSRRLRGQISRGQTYTKSHLRQIQQTNVLLQRATETVNQLNEHLASAYTLARQNAADAPQAVQQRISQLTVIVLGDDAQEKALPQAVQDRVVQLSHALLEQTNLISAYVKEHAGRFPHYIQERLNPLVVFFNERYQDAIAEASKPELSPVHRARNIIRVTTEHTLPVLQGALSELQGTAQTYQAGVTTSITNTADTVKTQLGNTARALGVK